MRKKIGIGLCILGAYLCVSTILGGLNQFTMDDLTIFFIGSGCIGAGFALLDPRFS